MNNSTYFAAPYGQHNWSNPYGYGNWHNPPGETCPPDPTPAPLPCPPTPVCPPQDANNASLGDRAWVDTNGDGVQNAGEAGKAGVTVQLFSATNGNPGTLLSTQLTDANGNYLFNNLAAGNYMVKFTSNDGTQLTSVNVGNDALDSDANASGYTGTYSLSAGEQNRTADAGFNCPAPVVKPCATLVGANSINEGSAGTYYVKLDQALDHDVTFTLKTSDQSAQRVDQNAASQNIMWGGYYTVLYGNGSVVTQDVNPMGGDIPKGTFASQGYEKAWGPDGNDSWDYTLYSSTGAVVSGGVTTVTIAAGQTTSSAISVKAWRESIHVDNDGYNTGYLEGTENFSVSITGTSDHGVDVCEPSVTTSICDTTAYKFFSPIALDLDGNGIQTTAIGQTTGQFDLLGDGTDVTSGWLSSGDAFLAVDASGNGAIDSVKELFGGNKGDGFAKLASFDSDGNGVVNASDARFGELLLWQDANSNHQSDAGELRTLAQAGIASLNVAYVDQSVTDAAGNVHGETSMATRADGSQIDMVDVYFNYAATSALASDALPATSELLGGDGLGTLVGATATTPPMERCYTDIGHESYPVVAELLRNLATGMPATEAMAG
jgi:serine-aspartate repeat-containing protein C/D/E